MKFTKAEKKACAAQLKRAAECATVPFEAITRSAWSAFDKMGWGEAPGDDAIFHEGRFGDLSAHEVALAAAFVVSHQ